MNISILKKPNSADSYQEYDARKIDSSTVVGYIKILIIITVLTIPRLDKSSFAEASEDKKNPPDKNQGEQLKTLAKC